MRCAMANEVKSGTSGKGESAIIAAAREMRVTFQSPLPPAEFIEAYSVIDKTAPRQLLDIFIKQASHRMECENRDLKARIAIRFAGQITGFLIVLACLTAGVVATVKGAVATAGIIFGTTIPFCAIVFVLGRNPRKDITPSEASR